MNSMTNQQTLRTTAPKAEGLYSPLNEHDACGIGFVVNMKGKKSHKIITQTLSVLDKLEHRGASGCEVNTGDGAGILIQTPHKFFKSKEKELGFTFPEPGEYAAGLIFMSQDSGKRDKAEEYIEKIIGEEGQELLGWRTVPTDNTPLGATAKASEPVVMQVFIKKSGDINSELEFERKLYLIRKRIENGVKKSSKMGKENFFVVCLSSRTFVYKGMLVSDQVNKYFPDLLDPNMESAMALVHSRFSTNTFPSWERAHPNRYMIHNGEINTVRGNYNWMKARESQLASEVFGDDIHKVLPVLDENGSDSAIFDNCLEFLVLGGRSLSHALSMMVPEPWFYHKSMGDDKKAYYEYHSCLMEPWDGPASLAATDGTEIVSVLDRNGLRPSRYWVTKDDMVIVSSEVGVLEVPQENVRFKGRLEPGRMFRVDTKAGKIISDAELKQELAEAAPYRKWVEENVLSLNDLRKGTPSKNLEKEELLKLQIANGYTTEDKKKMLAPMAEQAKDPLGSMGTDIPLAVLSERPQFLYNYFKQLFAQVTNPPIDAIREEMVTATDSLIGSERNLLDPKPENCRQLRLEHPILSNEQLSQLKDVDEKGLKSITLPIHYSVANGKKGMEKAIEELFEAADMAIDGGYNVLILSDRGITKEKAALPALLAVSSLHHHLIENGKRTRAGIVLESGEAREVHHFCTLLGYGCGGINPYLAMDSLKGMILEGEIKSVSYEEAVQNYLTAAKNGIIKVLSKMGISTVASYRGAQIFEALGLEQEFVDKYFKWTPTRIEGIGLSTIAEEVSKRHTAAFDERESTPRLENGGKYHWRKEGEYHLFNPSVIHSLQKACKTDNYGVYKEYAALINEHDNNHSTLRSFLEFKKGNSIPIEEVESVESICKRFKTGAMSYGSISAESHESLAIAMNRIGGKSNTGEGGEDPKRFTPDENGDLRRSAIKQVASGRFGVTSHYLVNADEIQIKMAQGAKPGEGGQLPGKKVFPWVAKVRGSTPGVELISPPPHHDIYSIEDLSELIYDLKNANRGARINVKLVSEVGVGTIAAGVAKGKADVVLVSGYDGGTGASPQTSINNAGLPWELGLAETHQTLVMNGLRSRIVVETDGQLKTGRDVAIATLLGAEEYGFATAPLVVMGCIMMRKCHLGTCPVGIATQDPALREKFAGDPAHVVSFMRFVAQELREIMAELGFKTVNGMVGRVDKLKTRKGIEHWKAQGIDLSKLLHAPIVPKEVGRYCSESQDHGLEKTLDLSTLLEAAQPAIENGEKVEITEWVKNTDRAVGAIVGSEVSKKYGAEGLSEDTIQLNLQGSAGQSLGAFTPKGVTIDLRGDANDYVGKGLSGGKISIQPSDHATFVAEENVIIGNVALYGASGGEAYFRGLAGERFAVRNSGAVAVVEGIGDHGCEYMTGGRVAVLGETGRNFGAGMSGGIAYVYDPKGEFAEKCNMGLIELCKMEKQEDIEELQNMISNHVKYTGSTVAENILSNWSENLSHFVKVFPRDYRRVLEAQEKVAAKGLGGEEALLEAFYESLA